MKESTVLSLSYGQIVVKPPEKLYGLVPESFETYQIAVPGNIVIRGTDLQNDKTSLRVGKVRNKGIITSAYLCLQANEKINPDYAHLLLHAYDLMKIYYGMGSGLRQNLDFSDFKRLPVIAPTDSEQTHIARFLDWKTAQINKFIKNKKQLIALLKEQKQVIINDVVTGKYAVKRVVDADGQERLEASPRPPEAMRPSGVDWLGDIPVEWEVRKLKHIADMKSGDNLTSLQIDEIGDFPVYGGNGLRGYFSNYNKKGKYLLVGRQGALCGNVHRVEGKFWATEHAVVTEVHPGILSDWYYYMLVLMNLNQYSESAAQPGISVEKIQNLRTALPPKEDQENIVSYIEKEMGNIDHAITRAEREITLIQEYRTRLVSDVVTGKIDVRGIKVPEVMEDLEADPCNGLDEDLVECDDALIDG